MPRIKLPPHVPRLLFFISPAVHSQHMNRIEHILRVYDLDPA
jgi:hypothetical protein